MSDKPVIAPPSFEERTIPKLRIRLIPFLFLLYVVAFLDRTNISFASLTMNRELGITTQPFGFLAGLVFWIARILISWGAVAMLTGFVTSVGQLYVARFVLGVAEAGFFPGIVLYLTYWFRQGEQAQAIALFMTALPVTSVLGAPISGLILDHIHWLGVSSWRWLLILEGIPAVVCGILTYFFLPSRPTDAKFLSLKEKDWLAAELGREIREVCH